MKRKRFLRGVLLCRRARALGRPARARNALCKVKAVGKKKKAGKKRGGCYFGGLLQTKRGNNSNDLMINGKEADNRQPAFPYKMKIYEQKHLG